VIRVASNTNNRQRGAEAVGAPASRTELRSRSSTRSAQFTCSQTYLTESVCNILLKKTIPHTSVILSFISTVDGLRVGWGRSHKTRRCRSVSYLSLRIQRIPRQTHKVNTVPCRYVHHMTPGMARDLTSRSLLGPRCGIRL